MNKQTSTTPILRPLLIGLCVGVVSCTLLLLAAAYVLKTADLPLGAATPIAITAAAVSALPAGWAAARCAGRRGLLWGAVCGALLFLIILLVGLFRGGVEGGSAAIKLAALVFSGAVGGILGVNRKRR